MSSSHPSPPDDRPQPGNYLSAIRPGGQRIRVLIVDDSAIVRKVLSEELSHLPDIEVVGTAIDPYSAREKIFELRPDVLTLDLQMPRMDGLSFLEKLMQHHPLPVVVVSSLAQENSEEALRALELGAVEIVPKPGSQFSVPDVRETLASAIRAAATARLEVVRPPSKGRGHSTVPRQAAIPPASLIVIGASAGGTVAIEYVLRRLPTDIPGIVIVQHMPAGFTEHFARRLDQVCELEVREATNGAMIQNGSVWIAPGGFHTLIQKIGSRHFLNVRGGPAVNRHKPSVDVLFHSVARALGPDAMGIVLSGMGADGAKGLLAMREAGAHTITQDEQSSIVYGMPKAAFEIGAAVEVAALEEIPGMILAARTDEAPRIPTR